MAAKTGTYTLINSTTLTTATASVTFSSIPGTYTDLVLVSAAIPTSNGMGLRLQFNSDTNSNYSRTTLTGYAVPGTGVGSTRFTNQTSISSNWQVGGGTGGPSTHIHNIQDYSNTTTYKTVVFRANMYPYSSNYEVTAEVGLWRSTSAITSITMSSSTGNLASGSTFKLYGIEAGNL